jgi:hypothetical protein
MKEKILEIIDSKCETGGYVYDVAAEEITAMVFEFVEWMNNDCPFWYEMESRGWCIDLDAEAYYDIKGLFNYWLTNIYKK